MKSGGGLPLAALTRLAWRNLWRNHRRTLIMLLAISVGVWAMIFMTALMRGMVDQMIDDGITALPGHVQIHHPAYLDDPSIENSLAEPDQDLIGALASPLVDGWTSRVRVPAMISSERASRGVTLLGVDPDGEIALGFDPGSIIEGRFLESDDDKGLVVGRKLLERLETDLGKRVVIMSQDPDNNIADRGFRIVGVYKGKLAALEEGFVYAGRSTVQSLLSLEGQVSEIAVSGQDYRYVGPLYDLVRNAIDSDTDVRPWMELDTYLGLMLGVMDGFVLVWVVVIFLALSFGLVNTLMMAVFERVREIGLMQALGMRPGLILLQVLIESLMLLTLGLVAGNLAAWLSIKPLESGIDISVVAEGMEMMAMGATLYPALDYRDMVMSTVVVIGLGLLASLLPAWRAAQLDPIRALARN
jgi:ABC-type lipoprotein release transport system permease subunit